MDKAKNNLRADLLKAIQNVSDELQLSRDCRTSALPIGTVKNRISYARKIQRRLQGY